MKVFISSTYKDLDKHRTAVMEILQRMKAQYSAMEFFGSRTDEAVPVCKMEINDCNIFVGIYAWRYGWKPSQTDLSITEQEFKFAKESNKRCLCYIIDEMYSWPPIFIDQGRLAQQLRQFKQKIGHLVRSTFTTPDNLAKQIAADIARELLPTSSQDSFGGILRINWEILSPELQRVLSTACAQAQVESDDGVVATRHVISALANIPNTARCLLEAFRNVPIQPLYSSLPSTTIYDLFNYDKPISSCVLASMKQLLPLHSTTNRLLALELAVELLKMPSAVSFRQAGIDSQAIDKTVNIIKQVAADKEKIHQALLLLDDAEVLHLAYITNIEIPLGETPVKLRDIILENAYKHSRIYILVGEIMYRYPKFVLL